jgi:hypothetical protein
MTRGMMKRATCNSIGIPQVLLALVLSQIISDLEKQFILKYKEAISSADLIGKMILWGKYILAQHSLGMYTTYPVNN